MRGFFIAHRKEHTVVYLSIGAVAQEAGCSPSTIKNYEKAGRIPPAERTVAGFRRYRLDQVPEIAAAVREALRYGTARYGR